METVSDRIRSVPRQLIQSASTFPVEALLGVTFFVLYLLDEKYHASDVFWLSFFPLYVLTFTLQRLNWKIPYVLSYFLWIPVRLLCKESGWAIGIAWLLAVILLLLGNKKLEDDALAEHDVHVVRQTFIAFLIGGTLLMVLEAVFGSILYLFTSGRNSIDKMLADIAVFVAFILFPLLCCTLLSEKPSSGNSRIIGILTDKVLAPALVLYAMILYVYAAIILIHWELPVGGVAYMVLSFLAVALAVYLLRTRFGERNFAWFFDHLSLICLPLLVLLWIGSLRRLSDYGLTTSRVYLLALVVLMTLFVLMLFRKRTWNFQPMALILACVAVLLTYIPGISAKDLGIRSQQKRLERILPEVLVDGKFPVSVNWMEAEEDPAVEALWKQVAEGWDYLKTNMPPDAFEERYGSYGKCPFVLLRGEKLYYPDKYGIEHNLTEKVDLGDFTMLVPPEEYIQKEDSVRVYFLSKKQQSDTLLQCAILDRLNAEASGQQLLVYENESYKAVFYWINDYRGPGDNPAVNFITGKEVLFRKAE